MNIEIDEDLGGLSVTFHREDMSVHTFISKEECVKEGTMEEFLNGAHLCCVLKGEDNLTFLREVVDYMCLDKEEVVSFIEKLKKDYNIK